MLITKEYGRMAHGGGAFSAGGKAIVMYLWCNIQNHDLDAASAFDSPPE
jgi:hypothetical protein